MPRIHLKDEPKLEGDLEGLLSESPMGVAVVRVDRDSRGRLRADRIFVNESLKNMFAAPSKEELLHRTIGESWVDADALRKAELAIESDTRMVNFEVERLRLDGSRFWVSMTSQRIFWEGEALTIVWHMDITERKRAEEALRESESRFKDIAESSADWFWETDADLRFTYMSPNVERIIGIPPEWHYGKSREDLLGPDYDREVWREHFEDLRARRPFRDFIYRRVGEGVEPKWLRVSGTPVYSSNGEFLGYRGSSSDITDQKRAQTVLEDAVASLSEGFALYDSDERLIVCNDAYRSTLPRTSELGLLEPGLRFEEILDAAIKAGLVPHDYKTPEEYRARRLAEFRNPTGPIEHRTTSGHWVRFEERKTFNGGTVAIRTDISERRRAAVALKESEELLRQIIDHSPSAIFLKGKDGRFNLVNKAFAAWFGLEPSDIIGKTSFDVFPDSIASEATGRDASVLSSGEPLERELDMQHADGKKHTIYANKFPVPGLNGGIIGTGTIGTDITERKQTEIALQDRESFLRNIIDHLPALVSLKDREGRYVLMNKRFSTSIGVDPVRALGKTTFDVGFDLEDAKGIVALDNEVLQTGATVYDERAIKTKKGSYDRSVTKFPIYDSDNVAQWVGTISIDLTDRKEAETLRAANQAKSDFLSSMSHELRTPMNSILGFGQLLADDPDDPLSETHQRYIDQVLRNGELLLALINQVLDLAKVESGKLEVNLEDISIATMIADCIAISQPMAGDKKIKLTVEDAGNSELCCRADAMRLRQVLLNLISNAIKYNSDEGTVRVGFQRRPTNKVRISVTDTGKGIAPENRERLFEPFNRLGHETGKIQGSGIGLTIAKELVELMDGHIDFESSENGSTFWVELPSCKSS